MKNRTKLTIAAALLAGGMMVACGPSDDRQSDSISGDVKGEKKETTQMSASELEFMINECNTALATLQQIIDSADSNPEDIVCHREEIYALYQAINTLNESQKRLLYRVFWLEESQYDIAREEGVSRVAIHNRLQKIFKKMKKILENEG